MISGIGTSPHLRPPGSVDSLMRQVVYALIPGAVALTVLFGYGVIWNVALAVLTALATEALMLTLRRRPLEPFLSDWSAVVTGVLLGLALPPLAPWWLPVFGTAFALVFGKHLYGGLGFNPFNPAMIGYVVLLISFPRQMTQWAAPMGAGFGSLDLLASLRLTFTGGLPAGVTLDSMTAATPLDAVRTGLASALTPAEIQTGPLWRGPGGWGWNIVNALFFAGGLYLIARRVVGWQIPAGLLAGLALPAAIHWLIDPGGNVGAVFHLASGATMIGAFFIATDPVSAATTPRGRLYYGLGIGLLTWIIRTWAGYPDGLAFAVLLMNMAAPLIDNYTRPRPYGHGPRS